MDSTVELNSWRICFIFRINLLEKSEKEQEEEQWF